MCAFIKSHVRIQYSLAALSIEVYLLLRYLLISGMCCEKSRLERIIDLAMRFFSNQKCG